MIGRGAYGRPWLIGQVMSEIGGGGHRLAAGYTSQHGVVETVAAIAAALLSHG